MEIKLTTVIRELPVSQVVGRQDRIIKNIISATAGSISENDILWVSEKNAHILEKIERGTIICSDKTDRARFNDNCTYLLVNNPRHYFLSFIKNFVYEKEEAGIAPNSYIDPSVKLGNNITIRAGVIIEKHCHIGNDVVIDSNTVIKKGTVIGDRVKIGANTTIGGQGFGYEKDEAGNFEVIPHIGNVVIEEDVEIGNNTAIDRAVLGSTFIRRNAKIDNLVHIAHGVEIGENSLIIANAMIAGSVIIGKNVWVAPSAAVLNKLSVGDNSVIGMGAVVLKNVEASQTVVGNPAKDIALRK